MDPNAFYGGVGYGGMPPPPHHHYHHHPPGMGRGRGGRGGGRGSYPPPTAPSPSTPVATMTMPGGMPTYGTEKDKFNCPFFIKTGACRHGDKCNRFHPRPASSVTILLPHLFLNLNAHGLRDAHGNEYQYSQALLQKRCDEFFEDVWMELMQFGEIVEMIVCRNTCEQLLGNVYVRFVTEQAAQAAMAGLQHRTFEGRIVLPEFSPVLDFVEACCKQNTDGQCKFREKDLCNFVHTEAPSPRVVERCMKAQIAFYKKKAEKEEKRLLKEQAARGAVAGGDQRTCYLCGESGHIGRDCPTKKG
eukprot:PhM_4_TR7326/c0_g1_i1/m.83673/K12836/U2AF1; splicing factor U2AF 35 kDa subunit